MTLPRLLSSWLIVFGLSFSAQAACDPRDPACVAGSTGVYPSSGPVAAPAAAPPPPVAVSPASGPPIGGLVGGSVAHGSSPSYGGSSYSYPSPVGNAPLQPVRAYLRAKNIPPVGAGAYGLVVFQSKATSANRSKLKLVCNAFVAFFPRSETSTTPLKDQMITVWPLDYPDAKQARKDDCDYVIAHYDLNASEAAIRDARLQHAGFDGEGPYLVGWSPSNARGVPDQLVLVIDMSADNSQALIDQKFLFWKKQIVEDPSRWRNGFSIESVRAAIRIFADQYGQSILEAIKLVGDKKP